MSATKREPSWVAGQVAGEPKNYMSILPRIYPGRYQQIRDSLPVSMPEAVWQRYVRQVERDIWRQS